MMGFSPRSTLTLLQRELLDAFFRREQRLFLTGGAALAGFYFGHRETEDLDLFGPPGIDLPAAERAATAAAEECHASVETLQRHPDFIRLLASRPDERCVIDLAIDRAPALASDKTAIGVVRVDTLRDIAANKVCCLVGRAEIKDLVDLKALLDAGTDLQSALDDATVKDGGVDPATLAWLLDQLTISSEARLPGGLDTEALNAFRRELVRTLRRIAYERTRRE